MAMYKSISNVTIEANKSEKNGQERIEEEEGREREDTTLRPSKQAQKDQDETMNRFTNLKKAKELDSLLKSHPIQRKRREG